MRVAFTGFQWNTGASLWRETVLRVQVRQPTVTKIYIEDDGTARVQSERGTDKTELVPIEAARDKLTDSEVSARLRELLHMVSQQMRKSSTFRKAEFIGAADRHGLPLPYLTMEMLRIRALHNPNYRCKKSALNPRIAKEARACRLLIIRR